jgi:hypothetical protein
VGEDLLIGLFHSTWSLLIMVSLAPYQAVFSVLLAQACPVKGPEPYNNRLFWAYLDRHPNCQYLDRWVGVDRLIFLCCRYYTLTDPASDDGANPNLAEQLPMDEMTEQVSDCREGRFPCGAVLYPSPQLCRALVSCPESRCPEAQCPVTECPEVSSPVWECPELPLTTPGPNLLASSSTSSAFTSDVPGFTATSASGDFGFTGATTASYFDSIGPTGFEPSISRAAVSARYKVEFAEGLVALAIVSGGIVFLCVVVTKCLKLCGIRPGDFFEWCRGRAASYAPGPVAAGEVGALTEVVHELAASPPAELTVYQPMGGGSSAFRSLPASSGQLRDLPPPPAGFAPAGKSEGQRSQLPLPSGPAKPIRTGVAGFDALKRAGSFTASFLPLASPLLKAAGPASELLTSGPVLCAPGPADPYVQAGDIGLATSPPEEPPANPPVGFFGISEGHTVSTLGDARVCLD